MDKKLFVNTHHAYLNTDIILSSELQSVEIIDELTGIEYHLAGKPLNVRLCAGKHWLYSRTLNEGLSIEIEDAIKLGGSNLKDTYVFDENPWVFVVTKDRLYVTNIETNEEKVEYNLSPDEIHAYSKYDGKTCDFFLFKTQQDYSIYNVSTGAFVVRFTNHIFSNSHLVIYKEEDNVIVYDYRCKEVVVEFDGQYSIGSQLFFVKDKMLFGFDLSSNHIIKIKSVGKVECNDLLVNNFLLKLHYVSNNNNKNYLLYSLGNGETSITRTLITVPYFISSLFGVPTFEYAKLVEQYKTFLEEQKEILSNNSNFSICCKGIKIETLRTLMEDNKKMLVLSGQVDSFPKEQYLTPFILAGESEAPLNFKNVHIESEKPLSSECKLEQKPLLGLSRSENLYVTKSDNQILLHNRRTNEEISLFEKTFDFTSYNSAYFTSDGKNVVIAGKDKNMGIMGFEEMTQQPFEVEGSTVARYAGFNGYIPEIIIEKDGRKPVWRDPISLKRINESEMSNHIFMSPDGRYVADMQKKIVYYNRLTKQEIDSKEYVELRKKYNWGSDAIEEEKKQKIALRENLMNIYGKEQLFQHIYTFNNRLFHSFDDGILSEIQISKKIEDHNNNDEEKYLKSNTEFVPLFVDELGYVIYKDAETNSEQRILIGRSVWFLNYVSFSYDSRYLAFGAKMKQDTWRFTEEGVYEIYDLIENKIVDRKDGINLQAVWMTMFNKSGDVAYYDSHANAMVSYAQSGYKNTNTALGKSLLCFSPSGKYVALSDQNYVSYLRHPDSEWGHQPSGNIFIHETNDLERCLEYYNDFGEGIGGTTKKTRRAGNVASAAFSSDEKHLLAVGEDGVIVIRNLHLDNSNI